MAIVIPGDSYRHGATARALLEWLRMLEARYGIPAAITEADFDDGARGGLVERYVNFTTTARSVNCSQLYRFAFEKSQPSQQLVAIGNNANPASVTLWSWQPDAVSQDLKLAWEGGAFHPETYPAHGMTGEADRWGDDLPPS